ncbi:MAG: hypothetical protein ACK4EY_16190 [Flavipsychrobacter sp.]
MAFDSTEVHWKDMRMYIEGRQVVRFTGFKCTPSLEQEYIYGAEGIILDIQPGNEAYPGVLTLYKSEIDAMNRAAIAAGVPNLMFLKWTVVVEYKATAISPRQATTYIIAIENYEEGMEQNAKSMPIALNFKAYRPVIK